MNRQQFLVGLLIIVAVTMLPYYFADQASAKQRKELTALSKQMEVMKQKVQAVRATEGKLNDYKQEAANLSQRLVSTDPFADMQRELTAVASRAGVQVLELGLVGPEAVKTLPGLVQYTATVEVAGTTRGFTDFLRLLEQHPLLIEIPDVKLTVPPGAIPAPTPTPASGTEESDADQADFADEADTSDEASTTDKAKAAKAGAQMRTKLLLHFYGKAAGGN